MYINDELAFFVGCIIGDGHLKKSKTQTTIELTNWNLIKHISKLCVSLFNRKFNVTKVKLREGKQQTYHMCIDSKAIYNLLKNVFGIPSGKKSDVVKIPKCILNSNKEIKIAFLKGLLATEGGKRRRGYGLSTASKQMWKDLDSIFNSLKVPILKDKWVHKKYRKEYYGITFKPQYANLFNAGVPEWSNGVGLGPISLVLA